MARVEIAGPRKLAADVLRVLQAQGTVQVRPLDVPVERWLEEIPLRGDPKDAQRLEAAGERLRHLLRLLAPLASAGPVDAEPALDPAGEDFLPRLDALEAELRAVDERRAGLDEERSLLARYEKLLVALAPLLQRLEGVKHVETIGVLLKRGARESIGLLEEAIARVTGGPYTLILRDIDEEQIAGFLAVPTQHAPAVSQLLFERGVGEVKLPDRYAGRSFAESVQRLMSRRTEIAAEAAACDAERHRLAGRWRGVLAAARREVDDRLARMRATTFCGETRHTFVVAGFAPEERIEPLRRALDEAFAGRVAVFSRPVERASYDEVPVVLVNRRWLRPFELLLAFTPLPRYGSIDPTPLLALFFPLYFGLILGDVGHGVLGAGIALLARKRGWGGDTGRRIASIALACSVSAILFGVLYGELFGELGELVGMRPILFDRRHAMMPLLAMVVALGGAQIALGLVLGFVAEWRQGHRREAAGRLVTLLVIVDVVLALASIRGPLPAAMRTPALWALLPLVAASIALDGLLAPLELVRALGNILSYSRLMAVGLASVMLGQVANRMAELVHPAAVGIAAAVFLHTINFTLGLVSPTIQALRLQYVEFFDKFFVPGGRAFEPLSLAT
jgi:V/A-type H+-transporting ATPase subunit I